MDQWMVNGGINVGKLNLPPKKRRENHWKPQQWMGVIALNLLVPGRKPTLEITVGMAWGANGLTAVRKFLMYTLIDYTESYWLIVHMHDVQAFPFRIRPLIMIKPAKSKKHSSERPITFNASWSNSSWLTRTTPTTLPLKKQSVGAPWVKIGKWNYPYCMTNKLLSDGVVVGGHPWSTDNGRSSSSSSSSCACSFALSRASSSTSCRGSTTFGPGPLESWMADGFMLLYP